MQAVYAARCSESMECLALRKAVRSRFQSSDLLASELAEAVDKVASDRPGLSVADRAAVDFHDRDDFGRTPGKKTLVGDVNIVTRERHFADFDAGRAGQFNHRIASDAFEDAGVERRRQQHAGP